MDKQHLGREQLEGLLQSGNIEQFTYREIIDLFLQDQGLADYLPDHIAQRDPRNGEQVLFNTSRADRPHDNVPAAAPRTAKKPGPEECIICTGNTTRVIDVAQLSDGFTFINKNLFPVVYPIGHSLSGSEGVSSKSSSPAYGTTAHGLHLLQWTSTFHALDWHNMPLQDLVLVMMRLAVLEKTLLTTSQRVMPSLEQFGDQHGRCGFVSIIKNSGSPVGGSIEHGHQQIVFSNLMPRRIQENLKFQQEKGVPFSDFILNENPAHLLIREYDHAALVVPYYMRRPFDMLLILKDTGKGYLHELSGEQLASIVAGWQDGIKLLRGILPLRGRSIAYNVIVHNGPGAGLYFEFLPYTQEEGGFEKLGLSVCQSNPAKASEQLKGILDGQENT